MQRLAGMALLVYPDPFLDSEARRLVGDAVEDPDALRRAISAQSVALREALRAADDRWPVAKLSQTFHLSSFELDLLLLACLPELDDRFGDVIQALQPHLPLRRPAVGPAVRLLLPGDHPRSQIRQHLAASPLWRAALLRTGEPGVPLFDRIIAPTPAVLAGLEFRVPDSLSDGTAVRRAGFDDPLLCRELELRPRFVEEAKGLARWLETVGAGILHLPTGHFETGRLLARALSHQCRRPLVWLEEVTEIAFASLREASVCALLDGAILGIEVDAQAKYLRLPPEWMVPAGVVIVAAPSTAVELPVDRPARRVRPPSVRPSDQDRIWRDLLGAVGASAHTAVLSNQTRLSLAQIEGTVRLATERARLDGRPHAAHADVAGALEETVGEPTTPLAQSDRPSVSWSRLVLPRRPRGALEEVARRTEFRLTVQDHWGMGGNQGRGNALVVLLHGESGTGKTLAAEVIATQLSLPLLRVDLSRVVSKYIGETEKHLSALFNTAEGYGAVLFFDEADALFGKRTGVKDAHDRYANTETNYMLQRLEAFEGIALLATNLLKNMDEAFTRRIQFIIHLPRPSASHQRLIWQQHLPADHLAPDADLQTLCQSFDLVGGEIRNAALTAAYSAAAQDTLITSDLLDHAVRQELLKKGRPVPDSPRGEPHAARPRRTSR